MLDELELDQGLSRPSKVGKGVEKCEFEAFPDEQREYFNPSLSSGKTPIRKVVHPRVGRIF